jgi:hypothetical protein
MVPRQFFIVTNQPVIVLSGVLFLYAIQSLYLSFLVY